jgi:hypothetical protein
MHFGGGKKVDKSSLARPLIFATDAAAATVYTRLNDFLNYLQFICILICRVQVQVCAHVCGVNGTPRYSHESN